jgi:hypothetical protein
MLPFDAGETWYVCQGYNGIISHRGNDALAFDLSVSSRSPGPNACTPNTANASTGRNVRAPASGTVAWIGSTHPDLICINLDNGGSIKLGHLDTIALRVGYPVEQNAVIGTVSAPNGINGSYAHIHMSLYRNTRCSGNIPFGTYFGGRNFSSNNSINQWSGTALTR